MKKLLLILALFISISASSQDTTSLNSGWVKHPTEDRYIPVEDTVSFSTILLSALLVTLYLCTPPILKKINQDKTKYQTLK